MGGRYAEATEAEWLQILANLLVQHATVARSTYLSALALRDADHLVGGDSDDILAVIGSLEGPVPVDDGKRMADTEKYGLASDSLRPVLNRLARRLDLAASNTPRTAEPVEELGHLALRLEHDPCPPGATICATVKAYGQLPRREVTVVIRSEGLVWQPKKAGMLPEQEPARPATITLSVDVNPKKVKVGQEYTARAECGSLSDEAVFVVDRVAPTVHADRPTCMMGGYMNITVVDPAVGAGGESVGDADGPRLVIGSYGGKTGNFRLEEARCSGGAFHWRVGCMEVDGGGAARRDALGSGRAGDGGGGAEGAAIACRPNQLIRIRYESAAGVAKTAVIVEGPDTPSTTDTGKPDPASTECESGGDGHDRQAGGCESGGDGLHDTETEQRGHKEGRAGHIQGSLEDGVGRRQ